MNRQDRFVKKLLGILALASVIVFCGFSSDGCLSCGSGGGLAIDITTGPPAAMEVNQTATIVAKLTNDSSNAGVDWSCTPTGTCGSFNPAHTASGANTVYTAPSAPVAKVVITAASTKKAAVTATANVAVNAVASASNINGTYTFFANGFDVSENGTSVAGSVVIDGTAGTITGGEQDFFDLSGAGTFHNSDLITGGTITIGSDGRGTITLTPTAASAETLSVTVVNNDHLLITEFDNNATSGGSLDLQTSPTSMPTGGNAFTVFDTQDIFAFGGVVTFSGAASTAGEGDDDLAGAVNAVPSFDVAVSGSLTAPDSHGRGTITLTDSDASVGALLFAYYVVGPEAFRLIEVDANFFAAGSMFGQGTAAGTFSAAKLNGNFVFGQEGVDNVGIFLYGAAGQFKTDGASKLSSGVADVNEGDGSPKTASSLTTTASAYGVKSDGYGAVTLGTAVDTLANFGVYLVDPTLNVTDPNNKSGGGGAVMLDLDANSLGPGIVVPQVTGAAFKGNYAISQDGAFQTSTALSFFDLVGQVDSDGVSNLNGLADYNPLQGGGPKAAVTVTGTFAADGTNPGRATATITINGAATPNHLGAYQASSALVLHVDVDSPSANVGTIGFGVLEQQQ
ncbi:MAG TPA: hypothetical protein VJO53_14000 [Candidatus Acidoferrales bacterium]|nr:hypothetical protein [Candidatus Acidoferrales bacterium]